MKNISTLIISLLVTINFAFAQIPPNAISYQAIVRNSNGNAYGNKDVNVRVSILEGSVSGTVIYTEIHSLTTNKWGLIDLEIGLGSPLTGTFEAIDWSSNSFFCKTEIDLLNSQGYEVSGISQFLSVPYAIFSGKAGTAETVETIDFSQITNVPVMFTGDYDDLTNIPDFANVAYSGDYIDLLNQPTIPADLSELTDNTNIFQNINYNDLTGLPALFDGNYNSLTNLPTLFSGNYNDLINKPTIPTDLSDLTDNTNIFQNISYNDLSDLPTLFDGDYNSLTNLPTLFSGNYNDLTGTPTIPADLSDLTDNTNLLFDSNYNNLTNLPSLFSGNYNDLSNLPTLFSGSYADLTNTPDFTGWDTDASNDFSGDYNDLTNKPANSIQDLNSVLTQGADASSNNITNLANPVNDQDAATKAYVDIMLIQAGVYTVKDFDGNIYKTVQIGNQIWMAENLNTTHYSNGTLIPIITDETEWNNLNDNNTDDAYCYYNNNSGGEAEIYGALYTWAAAMGDNAVSSSTNPSNIQGVCPDGWHLPSVAEWTELTDYLGGSSIAGGKLKETGTSHWSSPNTEATNKYEFTALPGGNRFGGGFSGITLTGIWWTSTEYSDIYSWTFKTEYNSASAGITNYYDKGRGCSVRCVKNNE